MRSRLEEAKVGTVLDFDDADLRDLRALLYADDMVLVAASNSDLEKLINNLREHANLNQYQFSFKKSKYMVFGDDTRWENQDPGSISIWLPSTGVSTGPGAHEAHGSVHLPGPRAP